MNMLHLDLILLSLSGIFTHSGEWGVKYPDNVICAVKGSNISIPCTYSYSTSHPNIQVEQKIWCSMTSNKDLCLHPPYVYNSALNTKSDFVYTGDDKSDCTLFIHNVQFSYSGEFKFRFITNVDKFTGNPGVTLNVTDKPCGNANVKPPNPVYDVNVTQSSSPSVTSKILPGTSNPDWWSVWMIVAVIAGGSVLVSGIFGAVVFNRRLRNKRPCDRRRQEKDDSDLQQKEDESDIYVNIEQEDESDIYANVEQKEDDSDLHINVQQKVDDSDIYANV